MFESLSSEDPSRISSREPWIEQVDFRLPEELRSKHISTTSNAAMAKESRGKRMKSLPSLEEILPA